MDEVIATMKVMTEKFDALREDVDSQAGTKFPPK